AYVKQGAVVSTHYSQVNVIRTIEDILGTAHLNLNTAFQPAMTDVFDIRSSGAWTYTAEASTVLQTTQLAPTIAALNVPDPAGAPVRPKHDAQSWSNLTLGMDFSEADRVPTARFNRVLWKGLMGAKPYPDLKRLAVSGRLLKPGVDND